MTDPQRKPETPSPTRSAARKVSFSSFNFRLSHLTGVVLGERYKIHGVVSRGVAARVYLAEDLESSTPVVLKMLSSEEARDPELLGRITREAQTAVSVHHPNVVEVLGVGHTPAGLPYIVMEALAGEPLDSMLRRLGKLPLDLALVLARQAATGLVAIHEAGLVHRAVRPDTLLVLGAPEHPYGLKLLDYGVPKASNLTALAQVSGLLGAVDYMAPEQILMEELDARSDVYALGIVLFQLFTGHLPFETCGAPTLLRHQLVSPLPPPSWLDEQIDPRLESIISNATRKHPDNRYPSMQALVADLDIVVGLTSGSVSLRLLGKSPDVVVPQTERGLEVLNLLSREFAITEHPRT